MRDKNILRRLIGVCSDISEAAYSEQDDVTHLLDNAEQQIFAIAENNETKGFTHIREALLANYEHLKLLKTDKAAAAGQPTGFSDLDKVLVGMGPGDLILVGARPGMGKTSFTMNVATKVAQYSKKAVCVFSLEMSAEQLVSLYAFQRSINMTVKAIRFPEIYQTMIGKSLQELPPCSANVRFLSTIPPV